MSARSWTLAWIPLVIAACGGGDSDESVASSPTVSASSTTVSSQAKLTDETAEPGTITLNLTNVPRDGLYVEAESTENGVASLHVNAIEETHSKFRVEFKQPYTVRPGSYTDTITLALCLDEACTRPIKGSPIHMTAQYTVTEVPPDQAPQLTVTNELVRSQKLISGLGTTTDQVGASVSRIPTFPMTVSLTATSHGISSAELDQPLTGPVGPPNIGSSLQFSYKDPTTLGEGFYEDTVTLSVCLDPACVNPIAGSPKTIRVQYQVGNGMPGPNGYTVQEVPVSINDLAWDAAHAKIYLATQSDSAVHPNSIAVVNPLTADIETTVALPDEPIRLAVSNDGQFLYVAFDTTSVVQRLQLPDLTLDQTLSLGTDPDLGALYAHDLQVAPNDARLIAIARTSVSGSHPASSTAGVALYDDAVMRPQVGSARDPLAAVPFIEWIHWNQNGSALYGADSRSGSGIMQTFSVSASGLTLQATVPSIASGRFSFANGLIYTDLSQVFDPDLGTVIGAVPETISYWRRRRVLADSSASRIFVLSENYGTHIESFDLDTRAPLQTATLFGTDLSFFGRTPFIRWGDDGLAYAAEGKVVIIHGPFLIQ